MKCDEMYAGSSPDEVYAVHGGLLWYALGPRATPDKPGGMVVYRNRQTLTISYHGKPEVEIGFDGFLKAFPASQPVAKRQAERSQAYALLREATRLLRGDRASESLSEAEAALRAAEASVDPYLTEWISRIKAKALAAAGRIDESEALFRKLAANPETGSEAAFDAGRAFHLQGHIQRALGWYRRGLGQGATAEAGRGKYEYLEGIVFCLGELGRWEDAITEVERFRTAYPSSNPAAGYREYIRWRMSETPSLEGAQEISNPDLGHYWQLEFRWLNHESAQTLLAAIDEEMKRTSEAEAGPFLLSLRGELLGRLGRNVEALATEREALRQTLGSLGTNPAARVHYDLVVHRFVAAARQAGQAREAENAFAELKLWKQRQRQIKD